MMVAIVALGSSYCVGIEKKREGERWNDREKEIILFTSCGCSKCDPQRFSSHTDRLVNTWNCSPELVAIAK